MSTHRNSTRVPSATSVSAGSRTNTSGEHALLDLEAQICDLYTMVQISASLFESQIERYFKSEKLQYISSYEMDMVTFTIHDLVRRASCLRQDFYAAANGENA